mgnify:CR=1 FL=1|tara:strand:- start:2976 stop:4496 length:1521 start_codon:yes stop_codon:yes gene_type:complete
MSTKLNARSPFYLNLTEPTQSVPTFDCTTAKGGATARNFAINDQGVITLPDLDYGTILSYTSSAGDFANNKFATVATGTARTVTLTIEIPTTGYTNSATGNITCDVTFTQPAYVTSGGSATCSGGPTLNGTISTQALNSGGAGTSINLASFFNSATEYIVTNNYPTFVQTTLSSSTLGLTSQNIGGSFNISVEGRDASYPTTCSVTQNFAVSITVVGAAFTCTGANGANLTGGAIAQGGAITNPTGASGLFSSNYISTASDGSALITSYLANDTGSNRPVTLYFKTKIPINYTNYATGHLWCGVAFTQPAALPEFTCDIANLTGGAVSALGSILKPTPQLGTVTATWSPTSFAEVGTITARTVTFNVLIPSGYSNTGDGSQTIACPVDYFRQPANLPTCPASATNIFYISSGRLREGDFYCDGSYATTTEIKSAATTISQLEPTGTVCKDGSPFDGGNLFYAVQTTNNTDVGTNSGSFEIIQINSEGTVIDQIPRNCDDNIGAAPV